VLSFAADAAMLLPISLPLPLMLIWLSDTFHVPPFARLSTALFDDIPFSFAAEVRGVRCRRADMR